MNPHACPWRDEAAVCSAADSGAMAGRPWPAPPLIASTERRPVLPGRWLSDLCSVREPGGGATAVAAGEFWEASSAPPSADSIDRHGSAWLRLLHRHRRSGHDLGLVLRLVLDGDTAISVALPMAAR